MKWADAGFTLVEAMVGLVVFGIAAAATTSLMFNTTTHVSANDQSSEASALAQSALENLRTLDYQDIEDGSAVWPGEGGIDYTVAWDVFEDDPGPGMKAIVVRVTWESKGETHTYETETIYSQVTA